MKIDPKMVNLYEAQAGKGLQKSKEDPNSDTRLDGSILKKDRIEISEKGAKHSEVQAMKAELVKDIEKGADTEKLQRLKVQIQNGTYNVSSSVIADSILKIIK